VQAASGKAVWTGRVITGVVSLLFLFSAAMKFIGGEDVKQGMAHLGLPEAMTIPLGILELVCTVIYMIPATCVQIAIGLVVWLGIYLREPRLRALIPLRKP
jgi:predicted DNA repair protein MutK